MRSRSATPIERLFLATYALFAFRAGGLSIGDNSAFAHLRTGRLIADGGGIPREDPYSFTARGTRWVVQSWLPEWTYGAAWRLGGLQLVVLEQAVLAGLLALVTGSLARAGSALRTAGAAGLAIGVGAAFWSPRPLLFGLLAFALLVAVVERRRSPLWLLPIVWVWVSSHGSFPLGGAWLAATITGLALDARSLRAGWDAMGRYLVTFAAGLGVAVINPLGYRLLTFPMTVGEKREIFRNMLEWKPPNFQDFGPLFSLVFIVGALAVLLRRSTPFRDLLPVLGFTALGLLAVRNLPLLSVALAPALGRALAAPERTAMAPTSEVGALSTPARLPIPFVGAFALAGLVLVASVWVQDPLELEAYPVEAVRYLDREGLLGSARIAHQDTTGGYLILLEGEEANVFIDDRVDMYPLDVTNDYFTLLRGRKDTLDVLERWDIEVVLWKQGLPLATTLDALDDSWRRTYVRDGWAVYERRY